MTLTMGDEFVVVTGEGGDQASWRRGAGEDGGSVQRVAPEWCRFHDAFGRSEAHRAIAIMIEWARAAM